MESKFGEDLSDVRIHTGARASESALALGARAYTIGREIVFGAGRYEPNTIKGQRLLAHEIVHVLQQRGPRRSVGSLGEAETEACEAGAAMASGLPQPVHSVVPVGIQRDALSPGELEEAAKLHSELPLTLDPRQRKVIEKRLTELASKQAGATSAEAHDVTEKPDPRKLPEPKREDLAKQIKQIQTAEVRTHRQGLLSQLENKARAQGSKALLPGDRSRLAEERRALAEELYGVASEEGTEPSGGEVRERTRRQGLLSRLEKARAQELKAVSPDDRLRLAAERRDLENELYGMTSEEGAELFRLALGFHPASETPEDEEVIAIKRALFDLSSDFVPLISQGKDLKRVISGREPLTGEELGIGSRVLAAIAVIPPAELVKVPGKLAKVGEALTHASPELKAAGKAMRSLLKEYPGLRKFFAARKLWGAAGEAARLEKFEREGKAAFDLNKIKKNIDLIDLASEEGFVSVKSRGVLSAAFKKGLSEGTTETYARDLQKLTRGPEPGIFSNPAEKAADVLIKNRKEIPRSAWPKGLSRRATRDEIVREINKNAKLAIPSDHVEAVKEYVGLHAAQEPEKYGLKRGPDLAEQITRLKDRIESIGVKSTELVEETGRVLK
jgi:Domain of unknown function (DUF4157)/Pre-toxin TG